jgi:hypothetical protein
MSIAEFICEGGYVPGLSEHLWGMFDDPFASRPSDRGTKERREQLWNSLCQDDRWKYRPEISNNYAYTYGEEVSRDTGDYWGSKATFKSVPVPENMHRGSLAPDFIWAKTPSNDDDSVQGSSRERDTVKLEEEYMKRLICVLAGRFVCLPNKNEAHLKGMPKCADRYRWRYWDNEGNVYQDNGVKFVYNLYGYLKDDASDSHSDRFDGWGVDRMTPGDFGSSPLWMFTQSVLDRVFWEAVWCWKFEGSSASEEWNEGLWKLARQAGVVASSEEEKVASAWPLDETQLDRIAKENGWEKMTCNQPAMSSYTRDLKERINFYLSTGTAGTCLNHPTQGKTQLFRRGLDMTLATALLQNPRQHTGRGYKRKASEPVRACAECNKEKKCTEFSKNQRRKGSDAKCMECVSKSR